MFRVFATMLVALPIIDVVSPVHAQTPEEKVAFIIMGVEDGSEDENWIAKLISASPATFEFKGKDEPVWTNQLVIRQDSACIYTMYYVEPDRPDERKLETRLDFAKVTRFSIDKGSAGLRRNFEASDGFCFEQRGEFEGPGEKACKPGFSNVFARTSNPLPATATAERMTAAFAEFRKSVCPAAAQ
jgi:hypothetical protein